ncbi:hypothetical protein [Glutamicibacter nicotianae]
MSPTNQAPDTRYQAEKQQVLRTASATTPDTVPEGREAASSVRIFSTSKAREDKQTVQAAVTR